MALSGYALLGHIGPVRDVVSYIAQWPGLDKPVELRRLDRARADVLRWQTLVRRHKILATFTHPVVRRVYTLGLDTDPPEVILSAHDLPALIDAAPTERPVEL